MSLKILHTSDWHLGKVFKETTFELLPIQKQIMDEIVDITRKENPDIVLIAGDIFDTYNPSFEAEKIFYETLSRLSEQNCFVFALAGNHDSPDKLQISKPLIAGKHSIFIKSTAFDESKDIEFENENFKLALENSFLKLHLKNEGTVIALKCLPYLSEVRLGLAGDEYLKKVNELLSIEPQFSCDYFLLTSHLSIAGAQQSGSERIFQIGGIEYIPIDFLPKSAHYIALGHLHRHQKLRNATYSGSIYPFDLAEIEHKKGVSVWENGKPDFIEFNKIPKIRKIEFDSLEDAVKNAPEDEAYYYVLIKNPHAYTTASIDALLKAYRNRLVNWQFYTPDVPEEISIPELHSLNEEEMFIEFYRAKLNKKPSQDILSLFLKTLEEVKNATN
ncbi:MULTISPECIES: metallophosphoesterase family protein [Thermodesulfovibrio]|uniref:Nuclease SbcCD subunit D n=1 Tax=Thermodesulfovibrio yellowstonii (strain ATCC 51303 / DSM 11347 / YP87) TaxID=289376 RepID=B5YJR9_THEYD|nr:MULTISPECIES: DNA repair exonuclease [Thermodesulfovibrio]ACI20535.1 exonuclease SbcD [Thermodesulfovibrio yellowstonii DSM 11347]